MGEDENGEEGKEEGWREREKGKEQTLVWITTEKNTTKNMYNSELITT